MKKIVYFAVFAALALVSCQEKNAPINNEQKTDAFTFKASIEQPTSNGNTGGAAASSGIAKATINESNQLVWSAGDHIGIYFPNWNDANNQDFILSDGGGTTEGTFTRASGEYEPSDAKVAFFPWQGTGSTYNNVYEGTMYFKLPSAYWSYDNNKMLTPLVASIDNSNEISFKHVGAAVKLTVNNLVSGTYKVKMSVEGKQITGDFHVNPANAGTDPMTLDAAENTTLNNITLNTWKSSGAFSWIFPVPELTTPKLTFQIIDDNGVTVWSKTPKAQSSLRRADLLVMPAVNVTAYEKFVQDDDEWTFHGTIGGSSWQDVPMMTDGNYCVLSGFTFVAGDQFKIHNKKTDAWYPASNWEFTNEINGTKDIIFNCSTQAITVVTHKFPYPMPSYTPSVSISIDGNMSDWAAITPLGSTGTDRIRDWKFYSDEDNLYFYLVLRKNRMNTGNDLSLAFKWNDSGTLSVDNLSRANCTVIFQPFTNADNNSGDKPTCVDGAISTATINGESTSVTINAYGLNPNTSSNSNSDDYYLEISIAKSYIPSLPTSGTIQIGAGYNWYNTSYQSVTLE